MDQISLQIIDLLKQGDIMTSSNLAAKLKVSEKTIRNRIKDLNYQLLDACAHILSKTGCGYHMQIDDLKVFNEWLNADNQKNHIASTSSERIQTILEILLANNRYYKLDDLCEKLFVSRNTISADLKQVEYILNLYHLSIERRPNYGIKIAGDEQNIRICITNLLINKKIKHNARSEYRKIQEAIAHILQELFLKYHISMLESTFENLIVHIYISCARSKMKLGMKFSNQEKAELNNKLDDQVYELAKEIQRRIRIELNIDLEDDEIRYIALHISGKASSDSFQKTENNMVISSVIDELTLRMLRTIHRIMGIDFMKDFELRMSLNQHMVPFDIRMRYDISLKNPLLEQVKREYAFPYAVAVNACTVLSEYYDKTIPDDEVGYFAILFALALEKRNKEVKKYNIVVVCASGRGTSQLFMYKFKQAFGKYIDHIYEKNIFEIEQLDFKKEHIDYIFTTIPLAIKCPVPIFEVSLFLEDEEIHSYSKIFEYGNEAFIGHYFMPDLFFNHVKADTKEEVLKYLAKYIKKIRNIPANFLELVLKREKMGQTDFGNLLALPHTYQTIKGEKFVAVAILEKPIWWGHNEVQVIFLISLSEEKDQEIEQFYQVITAYLENFDLIQNTIQNPTFDNLMNNLQEAYRR